jgi:hypothetical protein
MPDAKYATRQPLTIAIGSPQVVELPPRVFRGRLRGNLFQADALIADKGFRGLREFAEQKARLSGLLVVYGDDEALARSRGKAVLERLGVSAEMTTASANGDTDTVDFFAFEGPIDPAPSARCPELAQYIEKTVETVDLEDLAPLGRFLELELVDEAGRPVPNARYRVVAKDGSVHEGSLDSHGKARVEPLPPGLCRVTFPELDSGAWDQAAVQP